MIEEGLDRLDGLEVIPESLHLHELCKSVFPECDGGGGKPRACPEPPELRIAHIEPRLFHRRHIRHERDTFRGHGHQRPDLLGFEHSHLLLGVCNGQIHVAAEQSCRTLAAALEGDDIELHARRLRNAIRTDVLRAPDGAYRHTHRLGRLFCRGNDVLEALEG